MTDERLEEWLAAGRDGGPSPHGTFEARIAPGARNRVELWRGGAAVAVLEARWLRTVSIAFSASERWVAAAGWMGGVCVWETGSGGLAASFPDIEADAGGNGRLPLLFTAGDGVLVCGGRSLAFVDTAAWKALRVLDQPSAALRASADPMRIVAYEAGERRFTRWTMNVKSFEIEGADLLRETRVYRGLFGTERRAS